MSIWSLVRLYGLTALVFFTIDIVWIAVVARSFYSNQIGQLLRVDAYWPAALAFYTVYIAGILVFAVLPGLADASLPRTIALGAFLGFFAYATFDLTCLALFENFPPVVAAVDLAWGTFLTGSVAAAGYVAGQWLGLRA